MAKKKASAAKSDVAVSLYKMFPGEAEVIHLKYKNILNGRPKNILGSFFAFFSVFEYKSEN